MGRLTDHCIEDRLMDKTYLAGVVPSVAISYIVLYCAVVSDSHLESAIFKQAKQISESHSHYKPSMKTVSDDARQVASYPFTACDGPQFGLLRCKKHQDKQV